MANTHKPADEAEIAAFLKAVCPRDGTHKKALATHMIQNVEQPLSRSDLIRHLYKGPSHPDHPANPPDALNLVFDGIRKALQKHRLPYAVTCQEGRYTLVRKDRVQADTPQGATSGAPSSADALLTADEAFADFITAFRQAERVYLDRMQALGAALEAR